MRSILRAMRSLFVLAGGVDDGFTKIKKTHIKKKYPFSSERQLARYRRQIANSQLSFHQIKV